MNTSSKNSLAGTQRKKERAKDDSHSKCPKFGLDFNKISSTIIRISQLYAMSQKDQEIAQAFLKSFTERRSARGELDATSFYKSLYNFFKIYTLGGDPSALKYVKTFNGFPVILLGLKSIVDRKDSSSKSYALTIASLFKACLTHKKPYDLTSIEGSYPLLSKKVLESFSNFVTRSSLLQETKCEYINNN